MARTVSVMVMVPAAVLTLGTSETPPRPARAAARRRCRSSPTRSCTVRADPGWRHADERRRATVRVDAFAIDRYEVTNAQYREFLDWITASRRPQPLPRRRAAGTRTTRRATGGTFNPLLKDAAYARTTPFGPDTFTGGRQAGGRRRLVRRLRLRGLGRQAPAHRGGMGAGRARHRRPALALGQTTGSGAGQTPAARRTASDIPATGAARRTDTSTPRPVGSYPAGRSPFGCDDMAGNVAEWSAEGVGAGPGSSRSLPSSVRCAARVTREPQFRTFTLGFRCAKDM